MNYQELAFGARLLDPSGDQPCVRVSRARVELFPGADNALLDAFFNGCAEKHLSRKKVFAMNRRHPQELFALSVLLWGFPTNQRGVCSSAFHNWQRLMDWIDHIMAQKDMTQQQFVEMSPEMDGISGLGISTFSKFLYFAGCSIDGHRCLILDNMVAKGIGNLEGEEFEGFKVATQNNRHRFYTNYPLYLAEMEHLATSTNVHVCSVEYVLWLAAKKNM